MIDPVIKSDLMLVKEAFEQGAEKQDGKAVLVPFREMVGKARQTHQIIQRNTARYPSVYLRSNKNLSDIYNTTQSDCIPCRARIQSLLELDIKPELYNSLSLYDKLTLERMLNTFKLLKGLSPIERDMCDIYNALKRQCIPDLQRLLAAMIFLIADIRSLDLKSLSLGFVSVISAILGRVVAGLAMGMDRYARLVTDVINCIATDLKLQFLKLNPILSKDEQTNLKEGFKRAWKGGEENKNWVRKNIKYTSIYNDNIVNQAIEKQQRASTSNVNKFVNTLANNSVQFDLAGGKVLNGLLDMVQVRVYANLDGAINELLKLLKVNTTNMDAMNTYLFQIKAIQGLMSMITALISVAHREDISDACGNNRGRQFLEVLQLPSSRLMIVNRQEGEAGNPDIVVMTDPPVVDNPVVKDILERYGIEVVAIPADAPTGVTSTVNTKFIVPADSVTTNFLDCMGKGVRS